MNTNKVISVKNLVKKYDDKTVLSDISFDINEGEFVSIIGSSGAGKSTLLRSINNLVEPTSGSIILEFTEDKKDICQLKGKDLKLARTKIGMIFQHYNLVYRSSVLENVLHGKMASLNLFKTIFNLYENKDVEKAALLLKEFGLEEQMYKRCKDLSGGQKQRVGVARALIQDPSIILCDEPIASLDPVSSEQIMDSIKKIVVDKKIPCIVNLHQVDVAKKYSDRIIGISKGKIIFNDKPSKLTKEMIAKIYGVKVSELSKI